MLDGDATVVRVASIVLGVADGGGRDARIAMMEAGKQEDDRTPKKQLTHAFRPCPRSERDV